MAPFPQENVLGRERWFAKVGQRQSCADFYEATKPSDELQENTGQRINPRQGFAYRKDERLEVNFDANVPLLQYFWQVLGGST